MRYRISVASFNDGFFSPFMAEIQPPLTELAAAGLCKALAYEPPDNETNAYRFATEAYVTRSDGDGTALFIVAEAHVHDMDDGDDGVSKSEAYVAAVIHAIIDPLQNYEVQVEPVV